MQGNLSISLCQVTFACKSSYSLQILEILMEMNLYRNSSRWLQSQALLSVHIIAFSCGQHTHNYAKHMECACACPDLSLCVCVRWPGHLRSAAACYVFLAKKCSITHTHTRTDSGGEREEGGGGEERE